MDRNAFLEALPFLVPRSVSWPVPKPPSVLRATHPLPSSSTGGGAATTARPCAQLQLEKEISISKRHYLSIEPLRTRYDDDDDGTSFAVDETHAGNAAGRGRRKETLGVAFFEAGPGSAPRGEPLDPALAPCEVELCVVRKASSIPFDSETGAPPTRSSARPPSPLAARPALGEQHPPPASRQRSCREAPPLTIASLTMKVNEGVYFVNWTRLDEIRVAPPDPRLRQPACLMLYFPGCLLRIFQLEGDDDHAESSESPSSPSASTALARYQEVKEALDPLVSSFRTRGGPSGRANVAPALSEYSFDANPPSPSTSSAKSATSSSGGGGASDAAAGGASPSLRGRGQKASGEDGAAASGWKHQQNSYEQSVDEFASLWSYLLLDASAVARQPSLHRDGTSVGSLLTTVALDLAASYGGGRGRSPQDVSSGSAPNARDARRSDLQHRLDQTRKEMDALLDGYFPAPRLRKPGQTHGPPAKRRRQPEPPTAVAAAATPKAGRSKDPNAAGEGGPTAALPAEAPGPPSPASAEQALRELVARHRELARERHAIMGLPTRD